MKLIGLIAVAVLTASIVLIVYFANADKLSLPSEKTTALNIRLDNLKREADTLLIVHKVLQCESGYRHIWSKVDFNPPTFGVAQFRESTFRELEGKSGMRLNFYSMQDQIALLKWSIENGYGDKWSCFRELKRKRTI